MDISRLISNLGSDHVFFCAYDLKIAQGRGSSQFGQLRKSKISTPFLISQWVTWLLWPFGHIMVILRKQKSEESARIVLADFRHERPLPRELHNLKNYFRSSSLISLQKLFFFQLIQQDENKSQLIKSFINLSSIRTYLGFIAQVYTLRSNRLSKVNFLGKFCRKNDNLRNLVNIIG